MDSIQLLIQKLANASKGGEDNMALLQMVEEIKLAIIAAEASAIEDSGANDSLVSVLMPIGKVSKPETKIPGSTTLTAPRPPAFITTIESSTNPVVEVHPEITPIIIPVPELEIVAVAEPATKVEENELPAVASQWSVPIEEPVATQPAAAEDQPSQPIDQDYWKQISSPWMPKLASEEVLELPITDEMVQEAVYLENLANQPKPEEIEITIAEEEEETPIQQEAIMPQDLNQKLAQRTKVLNEMFSEPAEVFSDTVVGPRISDLRKAISINEKYQFIEGLFRGDEQMFERSIKTLNNFSIHQEAQYWLQRELLIKLGWNDEDELVKNFYNLVSRRFS